MGWVCGASVLKGNATKKEIELHLLDVAENNRSGRFEPDVGGIIYTNKVFETYKQAQEYVEGFDHHDGNRVVHFKALNAKGEELLKAKLKTIDEKISKAYTAFNAEQKKLEEEFRVIVQTKAKPFVTCPHCKSKLSTEVINPHNNRCPLPRCNHNLIDSKQSQKLLKTYNELKAKREQQKQEQYDKLIVKHQEIKTMVMANIYLG